MEQEMHDEMARQRGPARYAAMLVALTALLAVAGTTGCATTHRAEPARARRLDELYRIADRVNARAERWRPQAGDSAGRMTYDAAAEDGAFDAPTRRTGQHVTARTVEWQ
jgi:cell division protein FtsN